MSCILGGLTLSQQSRTTVEAAAQWQHSCAIEIYEFQAGLEMWKKAAISQNLTEDESYRYKWSPPRPASAPFYFWIVPCFFYKLAFTRNASNPTTQMYQIITTELRDPRKVTEGGHWAWRGDRNLPPRRRGKAQTNPTSTAAEACIWGYVTITLRYLN